MFQSHSRHDDISADILASHMRSNNSYMYDLFQAVFRSTLTCPNCRRQSNTYDPFLSISLPIPQKTKRPIYVTVVYMDAHPKQVRIGLLMDQCQSVWDLRQTLASDTKIPESQVCFQFKNTVCISAFRNCITCVAVPLSPLNKREVLKTPYIQLWCCG